MNKLNLQQFTKAFLEPIHHCPVEHFDAYSVDREARKVWIAINRKLQTVKEVYFQLPQDDIWAPYFNLISPILVGLSVEQAMLLSWSDLYEQVVMMEPESSQELAVVQVFIKKYKDETLPISMLPAQLVRLALSEYLGIDRHPGNFQSNSSNVSTNEHLVCRCFGVSNKSLEKYYQQKPQATLAQLSGDLNAGAGCGHCHEDIELIAAEFCPDPVEVHINDNRFIGRCLAFGDRTPVVVALLVDEYLQQFWPGTIITRCAGKRIELAPPAEQYVAMVEALEQVRDDLSEKLGSKPFLLIHQQN